MSLVLILALATQSVFAVNTCVIDMCTEASGNIQVALWDSSDGSDCQDWAQNVLTSSCGVGFQETQCYVDCSGIYSWSGAYWGAMGCSGLGWPCGSTQVCSSSVSDVCQIAAGTTSSQTTTTTSGNSNTSPSALASETTSSFPISTTSPSQPSSPDNLSLLSTCEPCGSSQCSFTSDVDALA
jgi:hypothetical protein